MRHVFSLALCLTVLSVAVHGQSGGVTATVSDQSGGVIPGVAVTLSIGDTVLTASTDSAGVSRFGSVTPGRYRLSARLDGFNTVTRDVDVGSGMRVDVRVELRPRYAETVIVSVDRAEQTLLGAPATVTIVPAAEIENSAARDFAELLRGVAGLNTAQLNARDLNFDTRNASGILSNSQLVMVDGRSVYQDFFGVVFWDLVPVTLGDIDQIEVIGTPGSAVWGANALTGVINVRTRSPKTSTGGMATVGLGELGTRSGSIRWAQALERLSYKVSAAFFTQDAWERDDTLPDGSPVPATATFENQGTTQSHLDARVDWEPTPGTVWSGRAGFSDTSGLIHSAVGPAAWADSGSYSAYGSLDYRREHLDAKFYWNHLRGDTQFVLFGVPSFATTDTFVGEVTSRRAWGSRQAVVFGGNVRLSAFDLSIAPGESSRYDVGGFVEDQVAINRMVTWGIGARLDKFKTFAATVSPRTSLVFRPHRNHAVRVAFNRAFRAPSLLENFASLDLPNAVPLAPGAPPFIFFTTTNGSQELDPEVMHGVEVGYTGTLGDRSTLSATVYRNSLSNNIRFVPVEVFSPADPPPGWPLPPALVPPLPKTFSFVNIGTVRNQGLELAVRTEWDYGISTRASYTFQDDTKITESDPTLPLQLNRAPKHQGAIAAFYSGPRWRASVNASYTDRAFWSDVLDSRFWGTTDGFLLANGTMAVALPGTKGELGVSAINLFDRRIKQHVFGDILRRRVTADLRFHWN